VTLSYSWHLSASYCWEYKDNSQEGYTELRSAPLFGFFGWFRFSIWKSVLTVRLKLRFYPLLLPFLFSGLFWLLKSKKEALAEISHHCSHERCA
jgi:hypothetical protein